MSTRWLEDPIGLAALRLERLREVMRTSGVEAALTADPINVACATGVRNMNVFSMMAAARFALMVADGPVILWEFEGSEHVANGASTIDEVRTATGLTALPGPRYLDAIARFAAEVADNVCTVSRCTVVPGR